MFLTIKLCTYAKHLFSIEQIIYIKMDLALNNLQRLICHKTQQAKPNQLNKTTIKRWQKKFKKPVYIYIRGSLNTSRLFSYGHFYW